jgi:hypothetical protein
MSGLIGLKSRGKTRFAGVAEPATIPPIVRPLPAAGRPRLPWSPCHDGFHLADLPA